MGGERTGKLHDELTNNDHKKDYEKLLQYKIVLIEATVAEINDEELGWLEKIIMKAFKDLPNENLLNTRTGRLRNEDYKKTIHNLVKY